MVAEASPHSAQWEKYLWLIEQGWKAYQAEKREAATMILLHRGKRYAPLYPDGSFDRPRSNARYDRLGPGRAGDQKRNCCAFAGEPEKIPSEHDAINCKFPLPPARPELR